MIRDEIESCQEENQQTFLGRRRLKGMADVSPYSSKGEAREATFRGDFAHALSMISFSRAVSRSLAGARDRERQAEKVTPPVSMMASVT